MRIDEPVAYTKGATFNKALRKEGNKKARGILDSYYKSLILAGTIRGWERVEYGDGILSRALQHAGADVVMEKAKNNYLFIDEKVCFTSSEYLYFELEMYSTASKSYVDGWLTDERKQTDRLFYYIHNVGLYVFDYKTIKDWIVSNRETFIRHASNEGDSMSNRNVKVPVERLKDVKHSFVGAEELETVYRLVNKIA